MRPDIFPDKLPLLLFDYDGVIADSLEVYFQEFTQACATMGYHHLNSKEAFLNLFDGNLVVRLMRAGFPLAKLRRLAEQFAPRIEAANARIHPFPGMPSILASLSASYPTFIITSNATAVIRDFVRAYELLHIYDVIGSDVEHSKVKRIRHARKLFPGHCAYYIGDTLGDMMEAQRAGAIPLGVAWGWHDRDRLLRCKTVRILDTPEALLHTFPEQAAWYTVNSTC